MDQGHDDDLDADIRCSYHSSLSVDDQHILQEPGRGLRVPDSLDSTALGDGASPKVWFGDSSFVQYYYNSLKVAVISTFGATFLSALAAYGFSRVEFKGREALFVIYLSMMMIPPQVLFVPKFIMFN